MSCELKCGNGIKLFLIVKSLSAFLLAITISFSLVSASSSLTVCAAEELPYSSDYPTEYPYWIIVQNISANAYHFYNMDTKLYVGESSDGIVAYYSNDCNVHVYQSVDGVWKSYSFSSPSANSRLGSLSGGNFQIVASNYDVYYADGETVFFHGPSPLVTVTKAIQPEKVLGQILGLLPLLIPCLVGLVAFSKGWRFLSSLLRKA